MDNFLNNIYSWISSHGIRVILIILIGVIVQKILKKYSAKLIKALMKQANFLVDGNTEISNNRLNTISNIFNSTSRVVIVGIVLIMILSEFGFDVTPIIAGAGIIGLAIGFGSQSLVKDLVSGFFILVENQYDIGDVVSFGCISGTKIEGVVKKINLRRSIIEDEKGNIHIVPNGSVVLVTKVNKTQ